MNASARQPSLPPLFASSRASSARTGAGGGGDAASPPYRVIAIDRAGLCRPAEEEAAEEGRAGGGGGGDGDDPSTPSTPTSTSPSPLLPESPLTPHLRALITFRGGPLTVSEYMATCLTHPSAGYYTSREAVFGGRGDFVTGPDVSQLMGELVGVWCAAEWAGPLGRPAGGVRLVELGPGRGTLAADLLRGAVGLAGGAWAAAIREIVFVEVSPARRAEQWAALGCVQRWDGGGGGGGGPAPPPSTDGQPPIVRGLATLTVPKGAPAPIPVTWAASLADVPAAGRTTLYLAHEFFDALPVHHFQRADAGQRSTKKKKASGGGGGESSAAGAPPLPAASAWRERLVDVSPPRALGPPFRFVLAPGPTPASTTILPRRLASLEPGVAASLGAIEVCPAGMALAGDLARRVTGEAGRAERGGGGEGAAGDGGGSGAGGDGSGAALIIDYGRAGPPYADSLVGIKGHAPASVLAAPGQVDLSARVDFGALAAAATDAGAGGSACVSVHGPIPQAHFLLGLGLATRLAALEAAAGGADTEAGAAVRLGALRLVGGHEVEEGEGEGVAAAAEEAGPATGAADLPVEGMGYTYQVMALTKKAGRGPPAPFSKEEG